MSTPTTNHKNSKKIILKRKTTFAEAIQTGAMEFMSMSKKSIGSYYESKNAKGIGSGLSFAERDVIMPYLIDVPNTDREFMKKSKEFFECMATPVPFEDGISLEIGLELDNDKPVTYVEKDTDGKVTAKNIPIIPMDYVRWRHALGHPQVAKSLKEAMGNPLVTFYIHDASEVIEQNTLAGKEKDNALLAYLKVKEDPEKVSKLLTLMGVDYRIYHGPNAASERATKLRELADTRFKEFNDTYEDKMFEEKYLLQAMMDAGITRRVGNQFIFIETNKIIGHTEEEALFFFKDPVNSGAVVVMKGLLQEAGKIKVTAKKANRMPVGR